MKKVARYKLFLLLTLTGIFLTACSGSKTQSPGVDSDVVQEQVKEIDQPQQEVIDQLLTESSDAEPTPIEVEPTDEIDRAPRAGLEASDPTAVSIASGKPTLVEFFAFW
jgi:hypothetical protein